MEQTIVTVETKTYIPNDKVAGELRRLYYHEKEINDRLDLDAVIQISYYGLILDIDTLENPKYFIEAVKEYLGILKDHYRTGSLQRKKNPEEKVYRGLPGMTLNDCVAYAIHKARNDVLNAIYEYTAWKQWVFKFQFNTMEVEFNPLTLNIYSSLFNKVNRVVKSGSIR